MLLLLEILLCLKLHEWIKELNIKKNINRVMVNVLKSKKIKTPQNLLTPSVVEVEEGKIIKKLFNDMEDTTIISNQLTVFIFYFY